jgi:hypothetical protein
MYKDILNETNVKLLDEILKICATIGTVTKDNLPIYGKDKYFGDISDFKINYYRDYYEILKESGYVKVETTKDNVYIDRITDVTIPFYKKGGFTAIYNEQLKEKEHQELLRGKDIDDAEISKFNRERLDKYERRSILSVWVAIGSIILSALAIGISIYSMFKS